MWVAKNNINRFSISVSFSLHLAILHLTFFYLFSPSMSNILGREEPAPGQLFVVELGKSKTQLMTIFNFNFDPKTKTTTTRWKHIFFRNQLWRKFTQR